jgi:hypothetical protein
MELAVHDSHFAKVKMLSELANRECVVRASRGGKVIPAFKAKTLDVISYPRIEVEEEKCEKSTLEKSKVQISKFSIGNVDLNEIMKSQSTGRRKIVNEG